MGGFVPITTNVVSWNPIHDEVYSIQHYVIKFVSDLQQVGDFLGPLVSSINKTDRHDITKMLLKMMFSTINQPTNQTNLKINDLMEIKMLG